MAGLNFLHAVAQAWEAGKLFHIDLNDQVPGRYDQDFRFGSANLKSRVLAGEVPRGRRLRRAAPFRRARLPHRGLRRRRDFARGCMRTYLILKERARQWNADPEIQALVAEFGTRGQRGLGYERLDQLTMEVLLGVMRGRQAEAMRHYRLEYGAAYRLECGAAYRSSGRSLSPRVGAALQGEIVIATLLIASVSFRAAAPISVMLLDGESGGPYHNWQLTTPVAEEGARRRRAVPGRRRDGASGGRRASAGSSRSSAKYQAVVLNYDAPDERWPAELKAAFERYVTERRRARHRPRRRTTRSPAGRRSTR